jgi:endonuclease IV
MPLFGAHQSLAGGVKNAILEAERLGMDTVQLFTKACPD